MAKKVWISLPLTTTAEATDAEVVRFTKGGPKKELEVETTAFIMKWLMDRNVPFGIDFDTATVDRNLVMEALPRRLQRALGYKGSAIGDMAVEESQPQQATVEPGAAVVDIGHPAQSGERREDGSGITAQDSINTSAAEDSQD